MMRSSQRQPFGAHKMVVFALLFTLCLSRTALAANDKEQKPEKTSEPTTFPSSPPSRFPTEYPTISALPTTVPSQFFSAAPTPIHSEAPSNFPSVHVSTMPSISPTMQNTLMAEVYGAVLPILTFDVILSDEEAILPMTRNIDSFFAVFLDRILDENSGTYEFDYSHLDSNVIIASLQKRNRRRLETGYSVKIDGIAYYFGDAPTKKSLLHSIKMYFNFWGKQDLEDYLHRLGLKSAVVASVTIDKIPIGINSDEDPPVGANVGPLETGDSINTSLPRIVAIGIYTGAILLIPIAALLVLCYSKRRRRKDEDKASYWKRDNQPASETSESEATPQKRQHHDEVKPVSERLSFNHSSYSITKSLASANVSIAGSNEKEFHDTSALVARGTYD